MLSFLICSMYIRYLWVRSPSLLILPTLSCMSICGRFDVLLNSVTGDVFQFIILLYLFWGVSWNCCDSKMFVHLPEYLLLKPFNKCEHVTVGVVLSEHSEKCHSVTHSLSLLSMKQLKLKVALLWNTLSCMISASAELYLFMTLIIVFFIWPSYDF